MSERRYVIPAGMLKAAGAASDGVDPCGFYLVGPLEAAIRWQSENPIVPTDDQEIELLRQWERERSFRAFSACTFGAIEWQRRMYLAAEPKVPEEIKDLLFEKASGIPVVLDDSSIKCCESVNEKIVEAYRRGQKAR